MSYIAYNIKADLTKHSMLNPVRLSAKCYDKHFAIFILIKISKIFLKKVPEPVLRDSVQTKKTATMITV